MKGRLIFKTKRQAGKVCALMNNIKDAEYNKRFYRFYRHNKSLMYEIFDDAQQKNLEKKIKKLKRK